MTEKLHYDFALNLEHRANVHRIEMEMIPNGALVLDVGCHTGIIGEILQKDKNAKVIGIDSDEKALAIAKKRLSEALFLDLETEGWAHKLLEKNYRDFDVILFGDVLEHTANPERILREAKSLLKSGGMVIVSVPNVAHWRI